MIALKRAYGPVSNADGTRLLVERLWPRGVSKAKLRIDAWLKEVGPSTDLRKWFGHDPEKSAEFRRRYFCELGSRREAWQPILSAARRGTVTLVYSSQNGAQQCGCIAGVSAKEASPRRAAIPRDESFWTPAPRLTLTVAAAASGSDSTSRLGVAAPFA